MSLNFTVFSLIQVYASYFSLHQDNLGPYKPTDLESRLPPCLVSGLYMIHPKGVLILHSGLMPQSSHIRPEPEDTRPAGVGSTVLSVPFM